MTHRVYRLYDAEDHLLYVGVTSTTMKQRLAAHRREKSWFGDVARVEVDRSQPEAAAYFEEQRQILELKPLHNRYGSKPLPEPPTVTGFAAALRSAREAALLSQAELAEAADVSLGSIRKWEAGLCLPESVYVVAMGDALGIGLDLLRPLLAQHHERSAA